MGTHRYSGNRQFLAEISKDMRKALQDFIACENTAARMSTLGWKPPTDVFETEHAVIVRMDIAGVNAKELLLGFDGRTNTLSIGGKRVDQQPERKTGYHQMEIIYGPFNRRIFIPKPINLDKVAARYENGFLEISFPKVAKARSQIVSIRLKL
ncbi:MAG: Hsp20/alpha crystallin family protein [Planctomycetes bacterium]|nr:Hsp20/alpha crystallin family protein [Planctomycetota bacterium]